MFEQIGGHCVCAVVGWVCHLISHPHVPTKINEIRYIKKGVSGLMVPFSLSPTKPTKTTNAAELANVECNTEVSNELLPQFKPLQ